MTNSTVCRWRDAGRLHPIHRGVYAVGHTSVPFEGRLVAALLHAGPGAGLSHTAGGWWWSLVAERPTHIDVVTKHDVRSIPGVIVHHPHDLGTTRHRRLLVTTVARTLLDLAAVLPFKELRYALANADYRRLLRPQEVAAQLGRGRLGSAALREALARPQPKLARTRSPLERDLIALCEDYGIEIPEINVYVKGWLVDAYWPAHKLIVEVDGGGNHSTPSQMARDRRMDLALRAAGFVVVRYSYELVTHHPAAVAADLRQQLSSTALSAARGSR